MLAVELLASAIGDIKAKELKTVVDGSHSRYRGEQQNISPRIKKYYSSTNKEEDRQIHIKVRECFEDAIVPDYISQEPAHADEMRSQFCALIRGDKCIHPKTEAELLTLDELLELAENGTFSDFLAETFIYAVKQANDAKNPKYLHRTVSSRHRDAPAFGGQPEGKSSSMPSRPNLYIVPRPNAKPSHPRRASARNHFALARFLKRHKIAISVTMAILVLLAGTGIYLLGFISRSTDMKIIPEFDRHVLLRMKIKEENAVLQYKMGLNNWRRLDYPKAERDIAAAQEVLRGLKGQARMDVARINNSLGCLYLDIGKYEEAFELLNSAYIAFGEAFDEKSIEVRAVKASLAQYEFYTGEYERALKETQDIIEVSNPKKDKAVIATTSHFRATVLNSLGRYDEALALYEQVLLLYEDIQQDKAQAMDLGQYTNDSSISNKKREYYKTATKWIILSYANMGVTHLKAGNAEAASAELAKALELCLNNYFIGQKNLITADIYCNLALAKNLLGDAWDALSDVEKAIAIQRGLFGYEDDYPGLAQAYRVQADICASTDSEKALPLYQKSLELAERFFGEEHPQTAAACQALGSFYLEQEDFEQALACLERSLAIRKSIMLTNNTDTLALYRNLQRVSEALGQPFIYAIESQALEDALKGR